MIRVPALDGVRGIAILAVMLLHFWETPFVRTQQPSVRTIDEGLLKMMQPGWAGVELFFVLSGFLITGILLDAKGGRGYFRAFYVRRLLRIFPLYYLFLALMLYFAPHFEGTEAARAGRLSVDDQWWFWLHGVNIALSFPATNATIPLDTVHIWSLSFEEQFYLVWPLIVLVLSRGQLSAFCCFVFVATVPLRYMMGIEPLSDYFSDSAPRVFTPVHADPLVAGALVALLLRDAHYRRVVAKYTVPVGALAGGCVFAMFLIRDGLDPRDPWVYTIGFAFLSAFFAALVSFAALSAQNVAGVRLLSIAPLRSLGKYSYCMYIVHIFVAFEVTRIAADRGWIRPLGGLHLPVNLVFTAACIALTYGIAWVSWNFFESKILRLKDRVPYGRAPNAGAQALNAPNQEPA